MTNLIVAKKNYEVIGLHKKTHRLVVIYEFKNRWEVLMRDRQHMDGMRDLIENKN